MNMHAQPRQLGQSPLTPAERMEAFIDAVTFHEVARSEFDRWKAEMNQQDRQENSADREWEFELLMRRNKARCQVADQAKALMADGLLERCAEILRIETAGRP